MRYYTVTLKIAYEGYTDTPNPAEGDELLDAVMFTIGEHLPEAQILEQCQHEELLVNKDLYEELCETASDNDIPFDDMHLPLNRFAPTPAHKPVLTEEEQEAFNDWEWSQGDIIKDIEQEQKHNPDQPIN